MLFNGHGVGMSSLRNLASEHAECHHKTGFPLAEFGRAGPKPRKPPAPNPQQDSPDLTHELPKEVVAHHPGALRNSNRGSGAVCDVWHSFRSLYSLAHLWDFGKSKRKAEKRGVAELLFVVAHKRRLLQKQIWTPQVAVLLCNRGTSGGCRVDLQVRGSSVPQPYQHTLNSLYVRCPLFMCGASPYKLQK